ncbi:MAG: M48 family metalloprotease [Elusimicrobiaceae bacterium]|nr:M48 family metalloprotease [Elusimicrobiaceae bacterium]
MAKLRLAAAVLALALACGCSRVFLPHSVDAEMGRKADAELAGSFKPADDAPALAYIAGLGDRVAKHSERPDLHFRYVLVHSDSINAIASPSATIYVTSGLLYAMKNDEIAVAGVLGHEMAHIIQRHATEKLQNRLGLKALMLFFGGDQFFGGAISDTVSDLIGVKYSREMELEADLCAARYLLAMGVNASRVDEFLRRLQEIPELAGSGRGYMDEHPPLDARVANIERYLQAMHSRNKRNSSGT